MMATTLGDAYEGSTYVVLVSMTDEDGVAMVPATAKWSLRGNAGSVVNSRSQVALTPATSMTIVLGAADLDYEENSSTMRTLTVEATYDGAYGNDLPLVREYTFNITPMVGV